MAVTQSLEYRSGSSTGLSERSVGSSSGPLKQLRIASLPSTTHVSRRTKPTISKEKTQNRGGCKLIKAKTTLHDPGFGFQIDFPHSGGSLGGAANVTSPGVKDSSQMATLFLESAKAVKSKYNVVDSVHSQDPSLSQTSPGGLSGGKQVIVSPTVKRRAEIIKTAFELKYNWLERIVAPEGSAQTIHPGLDHCYNPLQMLRNRVTRKKLNHPLPPSSANPLPCDAFSSHHSSGGKPWKMLWGIDLTEIVADYAWRKAYWFELRNSKGDLWYPEANQNSNVPKHRRISQKLHDKLWNDSDSDTRLDEGLLLDIPFQSRGKNSGKGTKGKWKEKARRFYGSRSSSAVDLRGMHEQHHSASKSWDGISGVKIARLGGTRSEEPESLFRFQISGNGDLDGLANDEVRHSDHSASSRSQPPQIVIDDGSSMHQSNSDILEENETRVPGNGDVLPGNVNDVFFSSVTQNKASVQHLERSPVNSSSVSIEASPVPVPDPNDSELASISCNIKYLGCVSGLSLNYLDTVYPVLAESTIQKLDKLVSENMRHLSRTTHQANSGILPARENLYKGFIDEAKSITHLANDECAVKIDNLLSAADRLYGELNTSLIMESRRTNERLDKLNRSLFGGVLGSTAAIDEGDSVLNITDHKFLYIALENVIVVVLRLVWIGANIFKPVFVFIKLLWKILKLIVS